MVLDAVAELNLEGIVCKHLDSPYKLGTRSPDWIKTPLRRRSEFVIGRVRFPGLGPNRHTVEQLLLLGAHCPDGLLQFCGVVGTGLSARHRRMLDQQLCLLSCKTSPFPGGISDDVARHARWVTPTLVGEVEYREFSGMLEACLLEGSSCGCIRLRWRRGAGLSAAAAANADGTLLAVSL